MRLADKTILVTGSTTGIGKAIAYRCVEEGARVAIHGLEPQWAATVVEELGDAAFAFSGDLSDPDIPAQLIESVVQKFGQLDGLVNNAAMVASGHLQNIGPNDLIDFFQVNTFAPFLLIKAALTHLERTSGSVVNIGSVNAYCGEPDLLPYSMTKGALMTMTRNLGDTLFRENRVRVNQVNPGWILTENEERRKLEHGLSANWHQQLPPTLAPSGSIIPPAAIAEAVVYWLSDACGPISGQVVDLEQYPFIGRNPPKDGNSL